MRRAAWLAGLVAACPSVALADSTFTLDGTVEAGGADHVYVEFEVPEGTSEIQIEHDDQSEDDILDWGLYDPSGFRGWGGGNAEPIVVAEAAASRSYLAGPIQAGTWRLVVGKAKLDDDGGSYHAVVTLRDRPTLEPQPEREPYADLGVIEGGARWYVGDFHVHSIESGDARPPIDEIVAFAKGRGLDFVELSDHNTTSQLDFMVDAQSRAGSLLLLPGVEFTTYAGHANGIGATAFVDHKIGQPGVTIEAAADAFHEQGALFAINHPAFDLGDACIGCGWKHELPAGKIDAVEIATAGSAALFMEASLAFWENLCEQGQRVAPIGGSDDHGAGVDVGAFGAPIGSPATYVFADELSVAAIQAGVRAGRTVVKVRGPDDPMIEIERRPTGYYGLSLVARIEGPAAGMQARWVKNGVPGPFVPIDADRAELPIDVPPVPEGRAERYRVELWEGVVPITFTSHVWIEAEDTGYDVSGGSVASCGTARVPSAGLGWLSSLGIVTAASLLARRRRGR